MKEKRFQKIYVEITNCCNLACHFCEKGQKEPRYMTISEFEIILNKIKPYTNLIYFHIKGEPLLHPNFASFLEICEKNHMLVNITTNATLLPKQLHAILFHKSIRQINISLHSIVVNENTKEKERQYLTQVINCVREIRKNTDILISYRLWNLENDQENNYNRTIIQYLEDEYQKEGLWELAKEQKAIKLAPYVYLNEDRQFKWPNITLPVITKRGKCFGTRNQIGILVDGTVIPCCLDQNGEIELGNIYQQRIEDILESKRLKQMKQGFESHKLTESLCQRCDFRTRFDGNDMQ